MQRILDKELYAYLTEILALLSKEKKSSTNIIDSLAISTSTNATKTKFCPSCKCQNIENRKKISRIDDKQVTTSQRIANQGVNVPEIYIPDLINLNPNLVASVEQILLHIEKISVEGKVSLVGSNTWTITLRDEYASCLCRIELIFTGLSPNFQVE
ncbi:hypothetical protein C2G38_2246676 [Gigaspora rosea]|uniref:Uncharacterized protein n=1 Tax=Gigaspora rosea TaxID=44941 RepID=A0A397V5S5_9GLOM|nr:hypothetical protein C2G38_2246676 [Gigaspora rosea]